MTALRPAAFRQTMALPNGETGFHELWETPSDPRVRAGTARSWAALEASWDHNRRQYVVHVRRLYTRTTGDVREIWTDRVPLGKAAVPATGADDTAARDTALAHARSIVPTMLVPLDAETDTAKAVRAVFLSQDVLA